LEHEEIYLERLSQIGNVNHVHYAVAARHSQPRAIVRQGDAACV
jgi:hypothetical protein